MNDIDYDLAKSEIAKGVKIPIWPENDGSRLSASVPYVVTNAQPGNVRLTSVTVPELAWFRADGQGVRPAVVVCPGGGYEVLSYRKEGTAIAEWLNGLGFHAFVLKYTCPGSGERAFADIQRAISLIRSRAAELNVDGSRIGAIGFSAGANLVARLSTNWSCRGYAVSDEVDKAPCRPDFTILIYPWRLVETDFVRKSAALDLLKEFVVDGLTPPAFIVQAEDDFAQVENSLAYYAALKRAGVAAEMHLYANGGHGYGMIRRGLPVDEWPELAARWLLQWNRQK